MAETRKNGSFPRGEPQQQPEKSEKKSNSQFCLTKMFWYILIFKGIISL